MPVITIAETYDVPPEYGYMVGTCTEIDISSCNIKIVEISDSDYERIRSARKNQEVSNILANIYSKN